MTRVFLSLLFICASLVPAQALEVRKKPTSVPPPPPLTGTPKLGKEKPLPEDPRPFVNAPTALEIEIQGLEEPVAPFGFLTMTFPREMVSGSQLDESGAVSPVVFWPPLDHEFTWRTPTQGELLIKGPVMPGQTYRLRLREGLTDEGGGAYAVDEWGAEMFSPRLKAEDHGYGERYSLNSRPQARVEFNYPIDLSTVADGTWFQDRVTRQRFPAEVLLNSPEGVTEPEVIDGKEALPDKVYGVRFRPVAPLPVGRFYDLVVDTVQDVYAGRSLPYPVVFPMGTTRALAVDYVSARNFPLENPQILVKFSQSLEEGVLPAQPLKISPAVPNLRFRREGQFLVAEGDFQIPSKYTVTISDQILGSSGYGLAKPEIWGATFRNQGPAVIFPDRTIRQRGSAGLRFAFYQVNTGALTWKLASIPQDQLLTVQQRLDEFETTATDEHGRDLVDSRGVYVQTPTEPLIDALALPVVASGNVAESGGDTLQLRQIEWQSEKSPLEGPVLLEITGRDAEGRLVGNRAIIWFGELAVTRKQTQNEVILRVAGLSDGLPVSGAEVALFDKDFKPLGSSQTDASGLVSYSGEVFKAAESIRATAGERSVLQPVELADRFPGAYLSSRTSPPYRSFLFTDRPLYRPGQIVHFKGFVRENKNGRNTIPERSSVRWEITQPYGREVFASGNATLDENGGWHASWTPPEEGRIGEYSVSAFLGEDALSESARFQIEEFRNPPFSVLCENEDVQRPGESQIVVQSQYFHGAPNGGARVIWKAIWYGDSDEGYYSDEDGTGMTRVDVHSENAPRPTWMAEATGESRLDATGRALLTCEPPFVDVGNRARCRVYWQVDVTGPDGQTITGGTTQNVPMGDVLLGVKSLDPESGKLPFEWDVALPFEGEAPAKVLATLYKVDTKSVKERLAAKVYRYRNFDVFTKAAEIQLTKPGRFEFPGQGPGRYVVVLAPETGAKGMPVSAEIYLPGEGEAEIPVDSDSSARVLQMAGSSSPDNQPWIVGENAVLTLLAPTEGIAWVSVETDRVLDTFTLPLSGNTARIEIPVKPEYEPNVYVAVYVLRPGGQTGLAGEMYGSTNLQVRSPSRNLDVQVTMNQTEVEPRKTISGSVRVTAANQPVANADLAIYAVDDSILELGGWSLPTGISSRFFPLREHAVLTYSALKAYVEGIESSWLTAKGFVVGDGGEEEFGNVGFTRKEFKPLILWMPSVKTGRDGLAKFSCEAPDNLTRFRFIAVGQTKENQFGAGDATVEVSKALTIDPALPRFVREGDEFLLRAVVRQKVQADATVNVRCAVTGGIELLEPPSLKVPAGKNAPVVVNFRARALKTGPATVKFDAAMTGTRGDSVEVAVPVDDPVILVKESVAGALTGTSLDVAALAPAPWKSARGEFGVAVSTTPWLPKLMGIPFLLEYPHGCFEQKSSRLLVYTNLARLLEYLPGSDGRAEAYAGVIEKTLKEFENSLLPNGMLPYWAGGSSADTYVTLQVAWCVLTAELAGLEIPERLAAEIPEAVERILDGRAAGATPSLQAFAFFMFARADGLDVEEAAAYAAQLYAIRDRLTPEAKALLAIGMNILDLTPEAQAQLVSELPDSFASIDFNASTFASATRTEALCTWARLAVHPDQDSTRLMDRLMNLMESSQSLSTQENLWLLVAFNALLESKPVVPLRASSLRPKADALAPNASAALWRSRNLDKLSGFAISGLGGATQGSWVLSAAYRNQETLTGLVSKGMRIERVLKNLTEPGRDGSEGSPLKLGDELLISYRFSSDKPQSFVALEDLLPAGVEVINPNLALFAKNLGLDQDANAASLSHSEIRDRQTNLYFDDLSAGSSSYTVLARATASGTFIWPATQITPMYDSRFFGRSPSSVLRVTEN